MFKFNFFQFIKNNLCYHNYYNLKVGRFPLVACYCSKCGKVKFGNSIYYDGSIYQKSFKGIEAIEFVKEKLEYLINRNKSFAKLKLNLGIDLFDFNEILLREEYETIEEYYRVIKIISNLQLKCKT